MSCQDADDLSKALKAYLEAVDKEPVPVEILRLAMELNRLLDEARGGEK